MAAKIQMISTPAEAREFLDTLLAMRVSAVALDTEYGHSRPGIRLSGKKTWFDIRSIEPVALSLCAWIADGTASETGPLVRAVWDLRVPGIAGRLRELLELRVPFVFHNVKAELFTFWTLGIDPDLYSLYDTQVAAAAIHLGILHPRAEMRAPAADAIQVAEDVRARRHYLLSLLGQCHHYGIIHGYQTNKDDCRQQFMLLRDDQPITADLAGYAAADAVATMRVYAAQQQVIVRKGLVTHLHTTEFPFAVANARIEWNGVLMSPEAMQKLRAGCERAAAVHGERLRELGMENPRSEVQFDALMRSAGLADRFPTTAGGTRVSTKDEDLELLQDLDPAIRAFRLHRKYARIAAERWLTGVMRAADGRHHPQHHQLEAQTGRNTSTLPNIAGIGKMFRPVVVAPPGRAILEIDFSQIEVAVCGAEYRDENLVAAYATGDVYAAMAMRFYRDALTAAELEMDTLTFKRIRGDLRARMKVFVLGLIYGLSTHSIASKFDISPDAAQAQVDRFLDLFPGVQSALEDAAEFGFLRGYAYTVGGLRRYVPPGARPTSWTRNMLRNAPIQGSATTVFKRAVIALDREFRGTSTKLIVPVHDAIVLECDDPVRDHVRERSRILMEHAVKSFYPTLSGKVDVNAIDTTCWNKDGHSDSIDRFLADPDYCL